MDSGYSNVTELLVAWGAGDAKALELLMPVVYDHLHQLAHRYMAGERPGHTLQASALVNEAYLRLVDSRRIQWHDRTHFYVLAAQTMRRILIDSARARGNRKRGGEWRRTTFDDGVLSTQPELDLVALDDALT